jgi:hypothetical protein
MRKAEVKIFDNFVVDGRQVLGYTDLQDQINAYLAEWQARWPNRRIVGISSHPARSCSDNSQVVYTFLYDEPEQDA